MTPAALNREQAAEYVGLHPNEFIPVVQAREMPRPRYLVDFVPFWMPADLSEALHALPYVDGTRAEVKRRSQVYFAGTRNSPYIKIGVAKHVEARLTELQTGNPERLLIFASFEGYQRDEARFHRALKPLRAQGEWFKRGDWFDTVRACAMAGEPVHAALKSLEAQGK